MVVSSDPLPIQPRRSVLRRTFRVLLNLVIGYVLVSLAVMIFQRRLIYFPTRLSPGEAEALASQEGYKTWRNQAGELIGWHLPAQGTTTSSVLVVHGNAGCALDRDYLARPIHAAAAVDVYLLEYPGYGSRPGAPSQRTFLAAGEEAFSLLNPRQPIYLVSESLGAGVTAHLAKMHPDRVSGLAFLVPYNNLVSVGQQQMPFLPVSILLWDRFDPAQWLNDYRGPADFVIAEADQVIAPKLGRRLHDGYAGPKRLRVIPGAGHNDVAAQSAEWWQEVFSFWRDPR